MTARWVLSMIGELPDTSNTVAAIRAAAPPPAADTPEARALRHVRELRGWGVDRLLLATVITALTGKPYPVPGGDDDAGSAGERQASTLADAGL